MVISSVHMMLLDISSWKMKSLFCPSHLNFKHVFINIVFGMFYRHTWFKNEQSARLYNLRFRYRDLKQLLLKAYFLTRFWIF